MRQNLEIALLIALSASPALAADMLPLKRGIYVDVRAPCKGAGNAFTLSYWGADNGINAQKVGCKIKKMTQAGNRFALHRTCTEIVYETSFDDEVTVTILKPTSFVMDTEYEPATPRSYRYCGPKVVF